MTENDKQKDELLLAAARRDESCKDTVMSELITRYVGIIVIKANKMARSFSRLNRQDAEDFISEGFLALLNAIRTFDESKGSFAAYANACIDNRMKNALGKARRTLFLSEEFDPALIKDLSPGAEDVFIEKENREEILSRTKKILSEREFKVFEMYLGSFSYRQIAARLGVSVKSVDNSLSRARAKLKSTHNR
ncbi:MAG: sigma-70 family RNA polymerase sigma factor [Oscillospiraceae bacterium]|jgi:RNA polymerase sporulation-specific sigma factor|nr:sigma-70 family RNA polymerase sigma factor [Oscillospiraceae bacterium]